ncbi:MAG: hypothetical protein R3A78_03940 [Polyangiales bacterium]|nr:hypothetical protein [Myxococcales bacterium]
MKNALATALVLVAVLLTASEAFAWSAIRCNSDPTKVIRYPGNGMPWPLRVRDNMPKGSLARTSLENSVALWNSTEGALNALTLDTDGYQKCKAPDNAGYGVVGLDDGTCSETLGFDWWGGGANGVRQYWVQNCQVVATTLYANPLDPTSVDEVGDVFSHELGHHLNYAHNWYGPSVMGYGVNMYWYLTSEDQGYIRTRFPDGQVAAADPHIHRTVLLTALGMEIQPDVQSQTTAPDPTCAPNGCQNLGEGDEISVILTYGNGGATATTEPVRVSMFLGPYEIGAWLAGPLPAHSSSSYNFRAKLPANIPSGEYTMSVTIDSKNLYPSVTGPSPARTRDFPGFRVVGSCKGACTPTAPPAPSATVLKVVTAKSDQAVVAEGTLAGDAGDGENGNAGAQGGCSVSRGASASPSSALFLAVGALLALRRRRR